MGNKKILIFSYARCGSTTLMNILNSQGLKLAFEPFSSNFNHYSFKLYKDGHFDIVLNKLDEKFDGFKHISFHINDEKNKILFERYKIVFLYRENPIEAAMSLALARKTSVFRKIYAQKEYFKKKFILDPEVVLELTLQAQKHYKYLEQIENPFVLSYEKLYNSDEETKYSNIEKLCDFAGIKITNDLIVKYWLDGQNHKLNNDFSNQIENYDLICQYLSNKIDK